jgi:acetamidase/formamidase
MGDVGPATVHHVHRVWDNALEPAVEVDSGAVVELVVPDAADGQLARTARAADLASIDFGRMNPVAGPVFVRGARPDDVLEVEVLSVRTGTWGWTGIVPGFGLLAGEIDGPWLRISEIADGQVLFGDGITLPARPFPGTIGVAPAEPGAYSVLPPTRVGGNVDIRWLTAGTRLLLPVGVEGALLSAGDGHAAQGDGEVCGSAIETSMEIALRVRVRRDVRIAAPQVVVPAMGAPGGGHIVTGVAEDLEEAAREAVRGAIDRLCTRRGLSPEEAYALISVAGDLRVHEVVNQPRWVVGMWLPDAVFAAS